MMALIYEFVKEYNTSCGRISKLQELAIWNCKHVKLTTMLVHLFCMVNYTVCSYKNS